MAASAQCSADVRVSLLSSCDGATPTVAQCNDGAVGEVARYVAALAAGTYYVIVGSDADPYELSVEAWPTPVIAPVSVAGNESCASAFEIPSAGGVFIGDTTAALDDSYATACSPTTGGRDVAFRWTTPVPRRVLVTTSGSAFATTVELRDASCGELACDGRSGARGSASPYPVSGALDLQLPAGSYTFIVDGWGASARGAYRFELRPL
jgi:hypothetical protein